MMSAEDEEDDKASREQYQRYEAEQDYHIDQKIKVGDVVEIKSQPHVTRDVWVLSAHPVHLNGTPDWSVRRTFGEERTYQCLVIRKDPYDRFMDVLLDEEPVRFNATLLSKMTVRVITKEEEETDIERS